MSNGAGHEFYKSFNMRILNGLDSFHQYQIHLYDKGEANRQRKMGHMTLLVDDCEAEMDTVKVIEWKNRFKLEQ